MTNLYGGEAVVRFQADRDTLKRYLVDIQAEWDRLGLSEPAVDEDGEIHPDAEIELVERLPASD